MTDDIKRSLFMGKDMMIRAYYRCDQIDDELERLRRIEDAVKTVCDWTVAPDGQLARAQGYLRATMVDG